MALKLHTCGLTFVPGPHPCSHVMKALDEAGTPYEQVKHPTLPRSRRKDLKALSGQRMLPVIELEDGRVYRAESKVMADKIRAGELGKA